MRSGRIVQAAAALALTLSGCSGGEDAPATGETAAYVLSEVQPSDPEAYQEYVRSVAGMIGQYGGRVLVTPNSPERVVEGRELEGHVTMLVFPSVKARDAFWNSPEYQEAKLIRQEHATSRIIHMDRVIP